uniref:Uncharacterized protein LOC111105395 n=1 Tax=Crassostrea virginica TaxID=6565 RepID=A0A8B8AW20_CRAVI|nr:uncharacterized protein LOC111105395 [Crassostrea virginica]
MIKQETKTSIRTKCNQLGKILSAFQMLQFEMRELIIFYHLLVLTNSNLCSSEEHCHHVHGCKIPQEIREDTTLSLSYGYTPLDVQLATSTHTYNKIEDKHQRFTNDRVINIDTVGIQKEESTMYLLKTAVVGLTFVVTVLFVSYACLGILMKRNRATHEDLVIINE